MAFKQFMVDIFTAMLYSTIFAKKESMRLLSNGPDYGKRTILDIHKDLSREDDYTMEFIMSSNSEQLAEKKAMGSIAAGRIVEVLEMITDEWTSLYDESSMGVWLDVHGLWITLSAITSSRQAGGLNVVNAFILEKLGLDLSVNEDADSCGTLLQSAVTNVVDIISELFEQVNSYQNDNIQESVSSIDSILAMAPHALQHELSLSEIVEFELEDL
jgi:hypothetical protein